MKAVYRIGLVVIAILVMTGAASSQTWNWASQIASYSSGGSSVNRVSSITVDKDENIYLVGDYGDSVSIGGTKLTAVNRGDEMFIAKINIGGTFAWAKSFGSVYSLDQALDITNDPDGNIYLLGSFDGTLDFGTLQLNAVSISSVALAKYNSSGQVQWAKLVWNVLSGPGGLAYDNDHIYAAVDRTLAKYTLDGDTVWTRTIPNFLPLVEYNDVAVDEDGNVYLTGSFTGQVTYGATTLHASSISDVDILIVKYDQNGTVQWAKRAGAVSTPAQEDVGRGVAVSNGNDVYVVGKYVGKAFFDADSVQMGAASSGMFIAKYNTDGDEQWVKGGSGTNLSSSEAYDVRMLPNQDILVAASFAFRVTIADTTVTIPGGSDVLMLRLGPDGARRWGKRSNSTITTCASYGLALNPGGTSAYVGGGFWGSATFGPSSLTDVGGSADGWIGKMVINTVTAVHEYTDQPLPRDFELSQNYPNPFNPTTTIDFKIAREEKVDLEILNILGEHVRNLVDQDLAAGVYSAVWDGRDDAGHRLASGVYFYRLHSGSFVETHKMMLLK